MSIVIGETKKLKDIVMLSNTALIENTIEAAFFVGTTDNKGLRRELRYCVMELSDRIGSPLNLINAQNIVDNILI